MKIHIPKTDKDKKEDLDLKKECLSLAIKVLSSKKEGEVTAQEVIEMADKFSQYIQEKKEK